MLLLLPGHKIKKKNSLCIAIISNLHQSESAQRRERKGACSWDFSSLCRRKCKGTIILGTNFFLNTQPRRRAPWEASGGTPLGSSLLSAALSDSCQIKALFIASLGVFLSINGAGCIRGTDIYLSLSSSAPLPRVRALWRRRWEDF